MSLEKEVRSKVQKAPDLDLQLLALEMEKGAHKPRKVSGLYELRTSLNW